MAIRYLKRQYPEDFCQGMELMYSNFRKVEYKGKNSTAKDRLIVETVDREAVGPSTTTPAPIRHI